MKTITLTRKTILYPILIWSGVFLALTLTNFNDYQLENIVGFLYLAIVPGLLTMILSKIRGIHLWGYISLVVGFSLLELILIALIGNTLLPLAGITRPLDKYELLLELYLLVSTLGAVTWLRVKNFEITIKRYVIFDRFRDVVASFVAFLFVVMSIFGAIRLNNGANNTLTMVMLGLMGLYLIYLLTYANDLDENTLPTAIFFMSLALLFMTSLRGWFITGHDIQSEFKVFQLAKGSGIWNIAFYRDAYNACMSITILPTLFTNLLNIPDPYVFKVFFQIFFALCPSLIYLIGRRWTSTRISLLGVIYFISFPTFFTDMPFLIRQETAFLFFGLMLYVIFEPKLELRVRQLLFMLMGIGIILSHYSTTYTILVIFGLAAASQPIVVRLIRRYKDARLLKQSALIPPPEHPPIAGAKITLAMVGILFGLSFVWTSLITNTGGALTRVLSETATAVTNGFGGDNRSVDINTLLSFSRPDQTQELNDYITKTVDTIRKRAPANVYFPSYTYVDYKFAVLQPETIPVSALGQAFRNIHIDMSSVMEIFGQLLAKLTEVFVPLGMLYLLFRKKLATYIDEELYLLAFYCLVFIGMNIALPVLSTEYGIFRAMQQSMFVIAPIIVLGSMVIGEAILGVIRPLRKYVTSELFGTILAVLFFFYSTHFLPYLFGDTYAVLHLSNLGVYYDNDLIKSSEIDGVNWLTGLVGSNSDQANGVRLVIQTDRYTGKQFASLTSLDASTDIFPGVIQKDGFVFLNATTALNHRATAIYNADPITYSYPMEFLDNNKNLIYDNGGAEVFR